MNYNALDIAHPAQRAIACVGRPVVWICFLYVMAIVFFSSTAMVRAQVTFMPLLIQGSEVRATDVSADGSVVVGTVINEASSVFRWTTSEIMFRPAIVQDLSAVSSDGSVVVGSHNFPPTQAFRWTVGGAFEGLGDLEGRGFPSGAFGASSNGQVVVGRSQIQEGGEAFRWTPQMGMVGLGDLPGGPHMSIARGVSADGTVVVGFGIADDNRAQAIQWTSATGMIGLGFLPDADASDARAISADGSVVVGSNQFLAAPPIPRDTTYQAFRWTEPEGMIGLGDLPGGRLSSEAFDVSADGSVIVGSGETSFNGVFGTSEAFYWTSATGMLNLREVLIFGGATGLDGWRLADARGVSADGRTVVGTGFDPSGRTQAFVATVGAIPEPSTIVLSALAALLLWALYLRQRSFTSTVG